MRRLCLALVVCALSVSASAQSSITGTSPDGQPVAVTFETPSAPPLTCAPASGALFPVGDTTVECTAKVSLPVTVTRATLPLLSESDFQFAGMFRLPKSVAGSTFDYAGWGLAYYPLHNSLFITGRKNDATMTSGQKIAEVSVPTPVIAATRDALPTAAVLQPFIEPTEGKFLQAAIAGTPTYIGDSLVVGDDQLCFTEYAYYDVGAVGQQRALFCRPLDFTVRGQVLGPVGVVSSPPVATGTRTFNPLRFANVYLFDIPPEWQDALGGPHGIGATAANGSASGSNGADAFATNLSTLTDPQPITPLLYFPLGLGLGAYGGSSDLWNSTVGATTSVEIPDNSRTVLSVSTIGLGPWCYGYGGTLVTSGCAPLNGSTANYTYDPAVGSKGPHAWPYRVRVWAWNVEDLIAVKNGTKQPWEPRPYAAWNLDLPFTALQSGLSGSNNILGFAYDHVNQRFFLTDYRSDENRALVYVFNRVKRAA